MLVLTRKIGEEVIIGNNITVRVVEVSGNRVRLGIEAPRNVEILRGELVENLCPPGVVRQESTENRPGETHVELTL